MAKDESKGKKSDASDYIEAQCDDACAKIGSWRRVALGMIKLVKKERDGKQKHTVGNGKELGKRTLECAKELLKLDGH